MIEKQLKFIEKVLDYEDLRFIRDSEGKNPLSYAIQKSDKEVMDILIDHIANKNPSLYS